jgi:hypothetical protein
VLLDDFHAVAVPVAEGEHGRHAVPAQHLVRIDAAGAHVRLQGVSVRENEPDAARKSLVRTDQRDRYGGPSRPDFDIRSAYMVADPDNKIAALIIMMKMPSSG